MCQNETPLSSIEETSETVLKGSEVLQSEAHETLATMSHASTGSITEVGRFLDGLSSEELLLVLGAIGFLIVVVAWFYDGLCERINFEVHQLKHWWRWKIERLHLRFARRASQPQLELKPCPVTHQSDALVATVQEPPATVAEPVALVVKQTELDHQRLFDELEDAKELEKQTQSELADAREQLRKLVEEHSEERADRDKQIEALKNSLDDQETQIEQLQVSLSETSSNAERESAALQEADNRCQHLSDDLAALKLDGEKSRSDLTVATREIKTLNSKLNDAQNDLLSANQKVIDKADEFDQLFEENNGLKSAVENLETRLSEAKLEADERSKSNDHMQFLLRDKLDAQDRVQRELDSVLAERESQLVTSRTEVANLKSEIVALSEESQSKVAEALSNLSNEQTLHDQLKEVSKRDREELSIQVAKLTEQESRIEAFQQQAKDLASLLTTSQEEFTNLKSKVTTLSEESQSKLADALSNLSREQALHNQLKEEVERGQEELSVQASKIDEQKAKLVSVEQRSEDLEQELVATRRLLEAERICLAKFKKDAQKRAEEMSVLASKNVELQSTSEALQQRVEEAERESADALELLKQEQERRAVAIQKLEASEKLVEELEEEANAPTVSVADYHKLVNKLIKYKKACHESRVLIDELVDQKSEMSELATEYLAMAKTIKHQLNEERERNEELKAKLSDANSSMVDFDENQLNRLADQRALARVMNLKAQFEQKIKQKNEFIRELQNRHAVESTLGQV